MAGRPRSKSLELGKLIGAKNSHRDFGSFTVTHVDEPAPNKTKRRAKSYGNIKDSFNGDEKNSLAKLFRSKSMSDSKLSTDSGVVDVGVIYEEEEEEELKNSSST